MGRRCLWKLDKIILAVITAVVTVCAEALSEKSRED